MLKINDLCVNYGMLEAVKNVSMEVPKGKVVSLLGANGSGKSTILKTVSGLKAPHQGEILFEDRKGRRDGSRSNRGARHLPSSGGEAAVSLHDGAGEPQPGRLCP